MCVVHGMVLTAIGLNGFWIVFAIVAAKGNIGLSHGLLTLWDMLSYLIIFFDIGSTVYFVIKLQDSLSKTADLFEETEPTKTLTYLTLLVAFSKGGILLILNVYLVHVVGRRKKEIDHDNSTLTLYILSQLARCARTAEETRPTNQVTEPPPAYNSNYPSYLPYTIMARSNESSGSSWSLSCGNAKTMDSGVPESYIQQSSTRNQCSPSAATGFTAVPLNYQTTNDENNIHCCQHINLDFYVLIKLKFN
ncbi:uncharacterized protein LOC118205490 isoform X2 [Stegodyphus dumicola]|uniref:uncharacterized protein LOC118205490 isoform X2 n=1 Tax=Stegodyphus dumicola TaxID=202533 RepID=UPI0015B1AE17|nr:uncharacterized protein LOC118205490 isoform X2 [Stegodyphus dumicola]